MPPFSDDDLRLLERARREREKMPEMTERALLDLAMAHGIELATAALYDHVRNLPATANLIRTIEGSASPAPQEAPLILVLPGAFHTRYPRTGADGARVFELAAELGWPIERLDVPGFAPMAQNAAALVAHLARHPGRSVVLVSLSKGAADMRAALARPDAASELRGVRAWVSLSGLVRGTPLVEWLRSQPLRCMGLRLLLRLRGQRFSTVGELRHGPGSALSKPFSLPPGLRAIHVFAFPLRRDLHDDWARRGHTRLAPLGPNDGGGILLADVLGLPGAIYPVWAADHYLRPPWDTRPLLIAILREAGRN